jgi:23S rRNA pseudouridine2605 synthase
MMLAGRVQVNGTVVTELGTRVDPNRDQIRVDGKTLRRQRPRYIMLNKPTGFITTVSDERDRWTVMDLVKVPERVYPVGRLDRATQGLTLMTNDGDLAHRIMHPSFRIDKEYLVFVGERPAERQLQELRDGVRIDGRRVVPREVRLFRESEEGVALIVVLHEGLYHVVRRMMELVGISVSGLRRTRLGPLRVQGIPTGSWRDLSPGELRQVYEAVGLPLEAADTANNERTIQLDPVGGFAHGGGGVASASASASQPRKPADVRSRESSTARRSTGTRQTSGGRRTREGASGNGNVRSSQRGRDRRTGRGR